MKGRDCHPIAHVKANVNSFADGGAQGHRVHVGVTRFNTAVNAMNWRLACYEEITSLSHKGALEYNLYKDLHDACNWRDERETNL